MIISNKVLKDLYDEAMNDNVILFFGSFSRISPSGWICEGEFKDERLNGQGKSISPNGWIEEGEFKDGKLNGQGKCMSADGWINEGEFKDGRLNGQGKCMSPNGYEINEGEFKDGKLNGQGKRISPNGYEEGEFKDGRLNGQGKVSKNGGNFKEGYFISGKLYNQKCKKYKPYKLDHLNKYFGKIINDNSKILKLALKLGWILTRCSNHSIYKKNNKTLVLCCTPKFPSDNYFELRNAELELLEIDY